MKGKISASVILALQTLSFHAYAIDRVTTRSAYGVEWLFTVDSGTLRCIDNQVTFSTGGVEYAVNGSAKSAGHTPMDPVWKFYVELIQEMANASDLTLAEVKVEFPFKVSVAPIIKSGLELCQN